MKNFRKYFTVFVIFAMLALNLAALDDIVTGSEDNYTAEYAVVISTAIVFVLITVIYLYKRNSLKSEKEQNKRKSS